MTKITLFSQLIALLPRSPFDKLVNKLNTDKHSKGINSWSHLVSMLFCQFGNLDSLRDISTGLRSITGNISHLGMKKVPSKSSLSYINKHRTSDLFRDFYFALLDHLCSQHNFPRNGLKALKRKIYIMDATLLPLCLNLFDWARFRTTKGAAKLHLIMDYDGCLPVFADLTNGAEHEIKIARTIEFPRGSIVVFDRGYNDFAWMHNLDSNDIFFVTRLKDNTAYKVKEVMKIEDKNKDWIVEDSHIVLDNANSYDKYPKPLRMVRILDSKSEKELVFLTNNMKWSPATIADVYKERWRIESFFKDLKQQLEIKSFLGTTRNAVEIQVWTALITMLLLKYLKVKAKYKWQLSNLVTFIRLNLFVKINLFEWIDTPFYTKKESRSHQLQIFSG